jgi:hypothetical protein
MGSRVSATLASQVFGQLSRFLLAITQEIQARKLGLRVRLEARAWNLLAEPYTYVMTFTDAENLHCYLHLHLDERVSTHTEPQYEFNLSLLNHRNFSARRSLKRGLPDGLLSQKILAAIEQVRAALRKQAEQDENTRRQLEQGREQLQRYFGQLTESALGSTACTSDCGTRAITCDRPSSACGRPAL